jgi:formylmethanofuran dehydrogenase subunit D
MTSPQNGIRLTIVTHEDVHLSVVKLRDGWGDAYEKKAAIMRLSPADIEKLGLKNNARVELTTAAGSVVVTAKSDAACEAGVGLMPSSLYTNRLATSYDPSVSLLPDKHIEAQAALTEKRITPVSDLIVRRNRA